MSVLMQDLRYALRTLRQRPGLTLVVILTLGLGIGINTVIFDFLNLVAWRRPPVAAPEELVLLHTASYLEVFGAYGPTSYPDYRDYREASRSLAGLAAFSVPQARLEVEDETTSVTVCAAAGDYFRVLGVATAVGRVFLPEDDQPGSPGVAVLSHASWQRLYGAAPEVVGETVRLNGHPFTVVGVVPEWFTGTETGTRPGVWVPLRQAGPLRDPTRSWYEDRSQSWLRIVGRLAPGVTAGEAEAELDLIAAHLDQVHPLPDDFERRVTVTPATLTPPVEQVQLLPVVQQLLAAVGLLLVIACANVANLLLARATARRHEMGLRQALGATRGRLVRQLLTESLLLALVGGLAGLLVAVWARDLMAPYLGSTVLDLGFDHRVLGLCLLACLASGLLAGLAPALGSSRVDLVPALRNHATAGRSRRWSTANLLVVSQVAVCTVLLAATGLLGLSVWNLQRSDLGFSTDGLLVVSTDLVKAGYSRPQGLAFLGQLREEAQAVPGVRAAGLGWLVPPAFFPITTPLRLPTRPDEVLSIDYNVVGEGYFQTLGVPLLRGRLFDHRDRESGRGVVVVNRALGEKLWPGEDPLGRRVLVERREEWAPGPEYEVVGVVGDTTQSDLRSSSQPLLYFSFHQRYRPYARLVVRTDGETAAVAAVLREKIRRLSPEVLGDVMTLDEVRRWGLEVEWLQARGLGIFGVLGLVLALVGVGSVMGYSVSRQVREIGIRMALGAPRRRVLGWVLGRGLALAGAGIGLGALGVLGVSRLLRGMLYGVGPADPRIFAGVALVLLLGALAAIWWPARRASKVDPLVALRYE